MGEDQVYNTSSSSASRIRGSQDMNESDEVRKRPKLMHTKSDTNVHRRNPFRGDSPPLPLASEAPSPLSPAMRPASTRSQDSSCGETSIGQKRHISFNTFVEQCIAIDKPNKPRDGYFGVDEEDEDGFDLQDDMDEYREYEDESDNDEDESEDDVLEMRPGAHTRMYNRRTPSLSGGSSSNGSGYNGYDMTGPEREHVTIAPIPPTMLKTSATPSPVGSFCHGGYGSLWEEEEEEDEEALFTSRQSHIPKANTAGDRSDVVNLVFVPPQGSVYAEQMAGGAMVVDVYGTGSGGSRVSRLPLSSPPQAISQLRAASFDDAALLNSTREEDVLAMPLKSGFDLFTGSDMGGVEDNSFRSGSKPRNGRSPGQARCASTSDLASRIALDAATSSAQMEELRSARSKGSSSSVSEEGTVMPPSFPSASSTRTAVMRTPRELPSSPIPVPVAPPIPSAVIPIPNHGHIQQVPSPAPSSTSTGTSSTTNSGTSIGSYGSSYLEPPSRGRSTSPITSASASSPSGDSMRGRSMRRGGSSISLSDLDSPVSASPRDKGEIDPPRGRSRSRSIGTLDGSVSPRSSQGGQLGRRGSMDGGGGIGMGIGLGAAYGLGASPTSGGGSLSPDDREGGRVGGRVRTRVRRGEKISEASVSPPNSSMGKDDGDVAGSPPSRSISTESSEAGDIRRDTTVLSEVQTTPSHASDSRLDTGSPSTPTPANTMLTPTPPVTICVSSSTEESATLVGRAVSSAKGYLGSLWGSQDSSNTAIAFGER